MNITNGFEDNERQLVAELYWEAFGQKLGAVMGPAERGIGFIHDVLDPTHGLCARDDSGALLGVAGFKTFKSALVGGTWRDLVRHFGWLGSSWRVALLAILERDIENERFLMDGVFVLPSARGKGVGSALLAAITDEARARGYGEVRLDVIDTNPRAKALYIREGFVPGRVQHLGPLKHVFGFSSATTMVRKT